MKNLLQSKHCYSKTGTLTTLELVTGPPQAVGEHSGVSESGALHPASLVCTYPPVSKGLERAGQRDPGALEAAGQAPGRASILLPSGQGGEGRKAPAAQKPGPSDPGASRPQARKTPAHRDPGTQGSQTPDRPRPQTF